MMYNKIAIEIPFEEQKEFAIGLKELALIDNDFGIVFEDKKIFVVSNNSKKELVIYPSMWNERMLNSDAINVSDKLISKALPLAYKKISESI